MVFKDLPFPPTMNHRLMPRRYGRGLTKSPEQRAYDSELKKFLLEKYFRAFRPNEFKGAELFVAVTYRGPRDAFYTKKNEIRKIDVDNRHKSILDVLCPHIGLEDSQNFKAYIEKEVDDSLKEIKVDVSIGLASSLKVQIEP